MARSEYLAMPGLNFSAARHLLRSPGHYMSYLEKSEDELKYAVGTMAHAMVLEGKDLRSHFAIKPAGLNLATREGKEWKNEQKLPILKEEDANRVPRMAEAIANHRLANKALLACPSREVIYTDIIKGVLIKGLLDAVGAEASGRPAILDIKTTQDARYPAFSNRISESDYAMQAVWYQSFFEDASFAWIVVENQPPFAVNVYYPGADVIAKGQQRMDMAITKYKLCEEKKIWSPYVLGDYSQEMQEIGLPAWEIKQLEGAGLI